MSGQACARSRESLSSSTEGPPAKKRAVCRRTVEKWVVENDRALNTSVWLKFDMADRDHVASLRCEVCSQFKDKLVSMRNFRPAFIDGTTNVRTTTFKEHAATDMHARAMVLFKKQHASSVCEYAPIAAALLQPSMDVATRERTKRKFDIAYMIAKENLPFTKMKAVCGLEERHGAELGQGYKNDRACATFVQFIAGEQQQQLMAALFQSNFFSLQADGSTDAGNVEDELFLVLHFDPYSADGKVHVHDSFFTVRQLSCGTAQGLFDCLKRAVEYMGAADWETKLIGFGCDGTNANMGDRGLKGLLKEAVPWVVVFWCLAHRLELSLKDALKSTFFTTIDELLLQIYFMYEKSPKKCRELESVVEELKACLEPAEMPTKGGSRPLRACGTRFVAHKVAALGRLIDRFGAYLSHLTAMTEDSSIKAVDRQKWKGYVLKWQNSKILLGCAFFHDLLKPSAILCKVLQEDELCVVRAIESVLKTKKSMDKMKATAFEELPTVKKVLARIQQEDGSVTYQAAGLKMHDQALAFMKSHYTQWVEAIEACLLKRLKTQAPELQLLTHAVTLLSTHVWERSDNPSFGYAALDAICQWFRVPLEKATIDSSLVQEEWDDMVEYAKQYLNLVQEDYKIVWWKLYNAVDAKKWSNVLAIIELLFCLPIANGRVERVYSQLKLIKNSRRTCLGEDTLDQLLRINVEGPPLVDWDATRALQLWWREKTRRVNHKDSRSAPSRPQEEETETEHETFSLDDWEEWIADEI